MKLKPVWKDPKYYGAAIAAIIVSALGVLVALCLMVMIDAATEGDMERMLWLLAAALGLGVAQFITQLIFRKFTLGFAKGRMVMAKNILFASTFARMDTSTEDNIAMYSTNTDIVYDNNYQNYVFLFLFASQFIFSVAAMIFLNWILFLVAFFVSLLPMVAPIAFNKLIAKAITRYSEASKEYIDFVQDSHKGMYEVKQSFAQPFFNKIHNRLNAKAEDARAGQKFANTFMQRTTELLGMVSIVVTIGVGGLLVIRGQVTMGVLIAVIQLINGMVWPIGQFFAYMGEMSGSKKLAESYLVAPPEATGDNAPAFESALSLNNVSYTYPNGNEVAVKDFSATFTKGKSYAILGESGSGKSTIAKILAGLMPPTAGNVTYDTLDIAGFNKNHYATRVQYIDQDAHLFNLSILENIEMGKDTAKAPYYLEKMGLQDVDAATSVTELSGGQRQRIVMARSLNSLPDVLILDEPTANLDTDTATQVISHLKSQQGLTTIVITHADNKNLLSLFDEVIRI